MENAKNKNSTMLVKQALKQLEEIRATLLVHRPQADIGPRTLKQAQANAESVKLLIRK